jgi:hypothetical protein
MKKAFMDLLYMIGLWFIGRCSPKNQADLMEKWADKLREKLI